MSFRFVRPVGLTAALALVAGACADGPTTAPPELEAELGLEATLEQMAAEATRDGNPDRAEAFRGGASALRFGVRPSEIEVKIQNETFIYQAIMVGLVRTARNGERVLVRTLIAWTGEPRPTAILKVSSRTDQALFGHPGDGPGNLLADTPGAARGMWADLVNRQRWIATAGSADMELVGTGDPCPIQPPADRSLQCVLASYDIRINGNFEPFGSEGGEHLEIHTNADGVNGVVLSPSDD